MLAARADSRCRLARKRLVLAGTTLFSELKEPRANLEEGDLVPLSLAHSVPLKFRILINLRCLFARSLHLLKAAHGDPLQLFPNVDLVPPLRQLL